MPYVDFANLMTYDLVGGYATTTGHHTPLYSTRQQKESSDNCIQWLLNNGVEAHKLIIGAAFYGRVFENVGPDNNGRYQPGKFRQGVSFNAMDKYLSPDSGFVHYWDDTAHAPYAYNASRKLFVTYDNKRSVAEKVAYMKKYKLGGIMFWVLPEDTYRDGLLDAIDKAVHSK
jgi:chitinase